MKKDIVFLNILSTFLVFSCHGQKGEEQLREIDDDLKNGTKNVIQLEIAKNGEVCYQTDLELIYHTSDSLGNGQVLLEEVNFPQSKLECCGFWVTPFIRIENTFDDNEEAWKTLFRSGVYVSSKEMICNNHDDYDFLQTVGYKRLTFDVTKFPNQYLRTFIWQHTGENTIVDKVNNLWVWKQEDFTDETSFIPVWCSDEAFSIKLSAKRMVVELEME